MPEDVVPFGLRTKAGACFQSAKELRFWNSVRLLRTAAVGMLMALRGYASWITLARSALRWIYVPFSRGNVV